VSVDVALGIRHVRADEDLLRRTLANLIENAIRHAPKGSVVRVTSGQQAGATEIRVADAGVGVPAKMRESIFDPFVRLEADEGRTARTGHGLGLAFCKLAVEAHGGWIGVEDAAPGAVFVVHWVDAARLA